MYVKNNNIKVESKGKLKVYNIVANNFFLLFFKLLFGFNACFTIISDFSS